MSTLICFTILDCVHQGLTSKLLVAVIKDWRQRRLGNEAILTQHALMYLDQSNVPHACILIVLHVDGALYTLLAVICSCRIIQNEEKLE